MAWKYICSDCENVFYPEELRPVTGFLCDVDGPVYETVMVCPYCGSEDYEDADRCEKCGTYHREGELLGGCMCEECLNDSMTTEMVREYFEDDLNDFAVFVMEKLREKNRRSA